MKNKQAYELAHHINGYLMSYSVQNKIVSEHTLKSYKDSLKLYLDFLEHEKNITIYSITYDNFNSKHIEKWLIWLMEERQCQPQSVNVRLSSIRSFLDYLGKNDIALNYLSLEASLIKKRRTKQKKVKGMSKEAIKTLGGIIDQTTKTGRRDITMVSLLYDTATRIDEILSLRLKDVHLNMAKPFITITGKGNKFRSLYLKKKTIEYIERHILEDHKESYDEDDYLFYSKIKGKQKKLTQPAVAKQLKKWAIRANQISKEVPIHLHAHKIRHTAATHWLEDGMNIGEIQYLLGHENIQTTMIYLEITVAQEALAMRQVLNDDDKKQLKEWKNDLVKLRDLCK